MESIIKKNWIQIRNSVRFLIRKFIFRGVRTRRSLSSRWTWRRGTGRPGENPARFFFLHFFALQILSFFFFFFRPISFIYKNTAAGIANWPLSLFLYLSLYLYSVLVDKGRGLSLSVYLYIYLYSYLSIYLFLYSVLVGRWGDVCRQAAQHGRCPRREGRQVRRQSQEQVSTKYEWISCQYKRVYILINTYFKIKLTNDAHNCRLYIMKYNEKRY